MRQFMTTLILMLCVNLALANNENRLRLHGSNTIGAELAPALVKSWLHSQGFTKLSIKQIAEQEVEIKGESSKGKFKTVEIQSHGSVTAFNSLQTGSADIGMSSRPVKMKENNRLKAFGDMRREAAEHVVGLDGIAVIVHPDNPVSQLDKQQIKKIFTGKITHWKQIDAALAGKIQVYARDHKSGTYDTFKALVLGRKNALVKQAKRYESNARLSDDVTVDRNGIGFVGLPYVRYSKAVSISEKGTIARAPQAFDVATEDYVLARRLYLYVADEKSNPDTESFLDHVISEQGQNIVDATGFVSQNLRAQAVELNPGFPEEYLQMTENSKRLSLNFRFLKGTTKLDNKSKRDVQRLVDYVARPENARKKIMLFGFAESSESLPVFSLDLSTYRVDRVSDLLVQNGIDPVRVRSYGDAIPIASNEDPGGRHKNRRVEVWIR